MLKVLLIIISLNLLAVQVIGGPGFFDAIADPAVAGGSFVIDTASQLSGIDGADFGDFDCRSGFKSIKGSKYSTAYAECRQELKDKQKEDPTPECINICIWRKLDFLDEASKKVNRTAIEAQIMEIYSGDEGQKSVKEYSADFDFCFNDDEDKPKTDVDQYGCKRNEDFTKCLKDKTKSACSTVGDKSETAGKPDYSAAVAGSETTGGAFNSSSPAINSTSTVVNSTSSAINSTSFATNSTTFATNSTSSAINSTSLAINSTSFATNSTSSAMNSTSSATNSTSSAINSTSLAINSTSLAINSTTTKS